MLSSPNEVAATPSRSRSFGTAVAALTVVRLGSIGAGFLASVIGARLIGANGLGAAGAAITIATLGALLTNGGLNIATIYLLGRRPEDRATIVGRILVLALVAAALSAVVVLATGLVLRTVVLQGAGLDLLLVTAGLGAGTLLFELGGGILLGLHRRAAYIGVQVLEAVLSLALTAVILVALDRSATGFLAAAAIGYWAGAIGAFVAARARMGPVRPSYSGAFTREALSIGLRGQVGNILQFLNLRLDLLLVPALLNLASAGVYLVAVRISEVVTQVSSSAASFLFPEVAAQAERDATQVTERTARMTLLVVTAAGLLLAAATEPLLAIFGAEFAGGALTVRIMLLAMLPLSLVRLLAGDLKGRGRPGLVSLAAMAAVVATIAFDLLLIPLLGIEGAAIASLLTYTTSAAFLVIAFRRLTGASPRSLVPTPTDAVALARWGVAAARRGRMRPDR